ncbi:hypothetical protein NYZ21_20015, partial [Acinetobacter baumannii]|nr:hypothetical protein [Acinetobacter baumannii]
MHGHTAPYPPFRMNDLSTDLPRPSASSQPHSPAPADPPPLRTAPATWATMALFFVNGATFATWGVHIPTIKARFGLSDA